MWLNSLSIHANNAPVLLVGTFKDKVGVKKKTKEETVGAGKMKNDMCVCGACTIPYGAKFYSSFVCVCVYM